MVGEKVSFYFSLSIVQICTFVGKKLLEFALLLGKNFTKFPCLSVFLVFLFVIFVCLSKKFREKILHLNENMILRNKIV